MRGADPPHRGREPPSLAAVLTAALALLAGCGTATPAPSQPTPQQVNAALKDWSAFPIGRSPRPLIILGENVTGPASGFPSGAGKLALERGAISAPGGLPSGPATAGGYPVTSASRALAILQTNATGEPKPPVGLTVSQVRLGTEVFPTDRGDRPLPAWLFSLAGVQDPVAVLAVAPARTFWPAGLANGTGLLGARLGRDGGTLTAQFVGAMAGTGPCTAGYSATLTPSSTAIAISIVTHNHSGSGMCAAVGFMRQLTVVLPSPLGNRVLVDAENGEPVPVTSSAPRP